MVNVRPASSTPFQPRQPIINIDSARSAELVNNRQFYVSLRGLGSMRGSIPIAPRACGGPSVGSRKSNSPSRSPHIASDSQPASGFECASPPSATRALAATPVTSLPFRGRWSQTLFPAPELWLRVPGMMFFDLEAGRWK